MRNQDFTMLTTAASDKGSRELRRSMADRRMVAMALGHGAGKRTRLGRRHAALEAMDEREARLAIRFGGED